MSRHEGACMSRCQSNQGAFLPNSQYIHSQPSFLTQVDWATDCAETALFATLEATRCFPYHTDKVQVKIELARQHPRPPSLIELKLTQAHQPLPTLHLRVCPRAIGQSFRPSPSPQVFPSFLFTFHLTRRGLGAFLKLSLDLPPIKPLVSDASSPLHSLYSLSCTTTDSTSTPSSPFSITHPTHCNHFSKLIDCLPACLLPWGSRLLWGRALV